MKSLVIYDSYFGNTERVAKTIAQELGTNAVNVKEFQNTQLEDLELLIVGSPTRAFSPSVNVKTFLKTLPNIEGIKVAAFDTRMDVKDDMPGILKFMVRIFGYAADPILKKLTKRGGEAVLDPVGFHVQDTEGPLKESEIDKAKKWVRKILD
jgi:flavodoxin